MVEGLIKQGISSHVDVLDWGFQLRSLWSLWIRSINDINIELIAEGSVDVMRAALWSLEEARAGDAGCV